MTATIRLRACRSLGLRVPIDPHANEREARLGAHHSGVASSSKASLTPWTRAQPSSNSTNPFARNAVRSSSVFQR